MKKKFLSLLLCAVMVCGFIPQGMTVFAASTDDGLCEHHRSHTEECGYCEDVEGSSCNYECSICSESELDSGDERTDAADNKKERSGVKIDAEASYTSANGAVDETGTFADMLLKANTDGGTLTLFKDVTLGEGESVQIKGNVELDLNGCEISNSLKINSSIANYDYCSSKDAVRPIQIVSGGTLTLKDSKADSEKTGNIKNGVLVSKGGTFIMESGSISNSQYLNGVTNSGTFTMNGGTISKNNYVGMGNHGGGVSNLGGTFVMNGGSITENLCYGYGETKGGGVYNTGSFKMTSGEISRNAIESYTKSYRCVGGGVSIYTDDYNGQSSFVMTGGEIRDNKVVDYDEDYDDYRGHGGGIHIEGAQNSSQINANFQMTGGKISGNTSALSGGGIYISNNACVDITEGEISNNEALTSSGGGISIYNTSLTGGGTWGLAPGELHMKNVVITENEAQDYIGQKDGEEINYGSYGGGIATCPTSQTYVYLTDGGAIYGNTSSHGELLAQQIKPNLTNKHLLYLSGYMLGGGAYNWTDSDGKPIEANKFMDLKADDFIATNSVTEDSSEAQTAKNLAKVFITGNKAYYTGGGIMNNGILEIGTSDASLRVEKKVVNGIQSKPYDFTVSMWTAGANGEKTPYNSEVTYLGSQTEGVQKAIPENGKITFKLGKSDYIVFYGLQDGVNYKVEEASGSNYEIAYGDNQTGVLSQGEMTNVVVTNTYPTGTLTITKKVAGDDDADKEKEFEFELTLFDDNNKPVKDSGLTLPAVIKILSWNVVEQETTLSLTDHEATREALKPTETTSNITLRFNEDGIATFKLSDSEDVKITLPVGTHYKIVETQASQEGYKTTIEGNSEGTITKAGENEHIIFTNTKNIKGSLTVEKKVTGTHGDKDKEFNFTVTLEDKDISGEYGDMTFKDGVASFTLKDGESKSAEGLPAGVKYMVTEKEANEGGYTTSSTNEKGNVPENDNATVTFTNTKNIKGSLTVEKKVTGTHGDKDKEFNFTVELEDKDIGGEYGDMTFKDGVASFTLKDGESKSAEGLPAGVKYTVTEKEADADGYTTSSTNEKGNVPENDNAAVTFTNTKNIKGSLTVEKEVTGTHGDKEKEFNFTVTLEDKDIGGEYGDMTFKDGVASFTLKDGESKSAEGLPAGVKYTVTEKEADADGYTTSSDNEKGMIPENDNATVTFTNTKNIKGSLTVEKEVTGTHGDKDKEFNFTVTLEDKDISGEYGDMTFKDGVASFTLKDGESKSAEGLPAGVKYMVTEKEADADGYTTSSDNEEGTVPENNNADVKFVNHKKAVIDEPDNPSTPDETNNSDKPTDKTTETDDTKTGDQANMGLYTFLIVISALGIIILVMLKKESFRK